MLGQFIVSLALTLFTLGCANSPKEIAEEGKTPSKDNTSITLAEYEKAMQILAEFAYHKSTPEEKHQWLVKELGEARSKQLEAGEGSESDYLLALQAILAGLNAKSPRHSWENQEAYNLFFKERKAQFNESIDNFALSGVGIALDYFEGVDNKGKKDEELPVVSEIFLHEARIAGLKLGDKISKVDGVSTLELKKQGTLISKIRGETGSTVTLTVLRGKDPARDLKLNRRAFNVSAVTLTEVKNNVALVQIKDFRASAIQDFLNLASILSKVQIRGLILDLRNNPGGMTDTGFALMSAFVKKGTVLSQPVQDGAGVKVEGDKRLVDEDGIFAKMPTVVLVNKETFGPPEILADYLQSLGHKVLGEQTRGLGKSKRVEDASPTLALQVMHRQLLKRDGTLVDGRGITPNVVLKDDASLVEKAYKTLANKK